MARVPYMFRKTVSLTKEGRLRIDYNLKNTGKKAFPFLWACYINLPYKKGAHFSGLNQGTVNIINPGLSSLKVGQQLKWPQDMDKSGKSIDFQHLGESYAGKISDFLISGINNNSIVYNSPTGSRVSLFSDPLFIKSMHRILSQNNLRLVPVSYKEWGPFKDKVSTLLPGHRFSWYIEFAFSLKDN